MGWTTKLLLLSLLGLSACQQRSLNGGRRRQRISAGKSEIASFNCPQDFGYYPHPSDCTQYYVCVFGGALQESCTGGLVYSHELETCDWPRNVECTPSAAGSGIAPVRSTDQRPPNSSPVRTATESLTPSVGSFDSRFEHSYTPKDSRSPQKFDGNDRSNSPRALFRQQPNPKQSLASPRFSQQSFFDTSVQESSQRPVNAKPTTFRPQVFSSNTRRPTSVKVTSRPLVDDAFYADLNFTDPEYFYYYDDLLYDYYDIGTPAASPATLAPAPRPAPTRVPIRDGIRKVFAFSDSDFAPARPISSFSFSGVTDTPEPTRKIVRPLHPQTQSGAQTQSPRSNSRNGSRTKSSSSSSSSLRPASSSSSSSSSQGQRATGASKKTQSQQGSSFPQTASQALRTLSSQQTGSTRVPSRDPDPPRGTKSFAASTSSSSSSSSSGSRSSSSPESSSRTPTRQSSSTNRGPPRGASSSGTPSVGSTVPKRSRRPTLKPVSVLAPSAPSVNIDIWRYPPRRPAPVRPHPPADTKATKCDPKVCVLPDCYCGGKDIPDGISPSETPQIVLLTFDDSVNDLNKDLYTELFENGRLNPNGCPIVSTMYVSHEWTDYSQVQNLYAAGHEMASHSIQHSFGEQFSTTKWAKEIAGQREILAAYGGVKMEDVRGMRAPFLAVGGNKMFRMLYDQNFTYDSSMPVYENNPPSWPYTLDYRIFHDCMIPPCPTNSYPGLWQVPMVMWQDLNGGRCSMGDACTTPPDAEGVYKMLIKNFERHYTTNRAPFGLFYHAAWFTTPHHKEGFIAFLDTITAMDDVWLTTNWQLIQWMRDPTPLSRINSFGPFGCNFPDRPRCTTKNVCNVWHKGGVRYMRTCQQCPETYPWTGNTGVRSPLNDS
ncbi:uncharacterized protein Cda5 isoform X8 [Panulirus ornatus]|uniref:uncharacterized protein Cda5 isoform X8 n=1 Tax=Panulirus ornatus TaxID=150431 RepID=UPI003A888B29